MIIDITPSGNNDDLIVQGAIDSLPPKGGKIRLVGNDYSFGGEVNINRSWVEIEGLGEATNINIQDGANIRAAFAITGTGTLGVRLRRFNINGNKINQTNGNGIYIDTPWNNGDFDPNHVIEDIYIRDVKNNGVEVGANSDTRVLHFVRVRVRGADGNGFFLPNPSSTDNVFTDCIAEVCSLNGFYLGCLNSHFTNIKAFWCGSATGNNHGVYIAGYNNWFLNPEAQDNYQSGIYSQNDGDVTYGTRGNILIDPITDSNNQSNDTSYGCGIQLKNCLNWTIIGGASFTRPYPAFTQRKGISLEGTTTGTRILGLSIYGNSIADYSDTSSGTNYPLGLNGYSNSMLPGKIVIKGQVRASGGFILSDPITLTDAANITTNASLSNLFYISLGGNRNFSNPTNMADGQEVTWRIKPNGFTPTFGTAFNFGSLTYTPSGGYDYITAIFSNTSSKWDIVSIRTNY